MVSRSEAGDAMNAANAESIRNVVDVPVIAVGRIHDPVIAEAVIANGQADLVAMARPLLADPEFPNKVATGRYREIRRCISCESCIDSMQSYDDLRCALNPHSGRETLFRRDTATAPRHLVVVGSGPAGMEAARQAAELGHKVTLLEKQHRLGGSLVLASTVHSDNEYFLDFLKAEMKRLPITIELGIEGSVAKVQSLNPDAVIVATGARVSTPDIPGSHLPHVRSGAQMRASLESLPNWLQPCVIPGLLRIASKAWMPLGREVAIIGADLVAVELAEFLAHRGRRVHLLDTRNKIAPEVGKKRRAEHMDRLDALGVTLNTRVDIELIERAGVLIRSCNGTQRLITANSVIIAGDPIADTTLVDQLAAAGLHVQGIGDCTGLGLIAGATRDAADAVASLLGEDQSSID